MLASSLPIPASSSLSPAAVLAAPLLAVVEARAALGAAEERRNPLEVVGEVPEAVQMVPEVELRMEFLQIRLI